MAYALRSDGHIRHAVDHQYKIKDRTEKNLRYFEENFKCLTDGEKCIVVTCTIFGGAIGGLAGMPAGGIGAVPGAALGAAGGAIVGFAIVGVHNTCNKNKSK